MKYRPEIDGLRALAVLPVIFFHAGFSSFSGGYVGVDIFFVISGYLISHIIFHEISTGKFSLVNFYERRARRILPALYVVLLACIPAVWLFIPPPGIKDFFQSLSAVSLFSSNVLFWWESGYFDTASELKPLLHTWSLGVEEQFYFLFPLVALALSRYGNAVTAWSLVVCFCISLILSQYEVSEQSSSAFFLIHSRAWELLAGVLLALAERRGKFPASNVFQNILSGAGLIILSACVLLYDANTSFPGINALVPVLACSAVIVCTSPSIFINRLLSTKLLVGIGLISYSAYLWHQPLLVFGRHFRLGELEVLEAFSAIGVTFVLAYLSWRFIEAPFRRRDRISRKTVFLVAAAGGAFFVSLGIWGHMTDGHANIWLRHRLDDNGRTAYALAIAAKENHDLDRFKANRSDNGECRFNSRSINTETRDRLMQCYDIYGPGIIVMGDSHAVDLFGIVTNAYENKEFIVGITCDGCRPFGSSMPHYQKILDFFSTHSHVASRIIYEQAGFYLLLDDQGNKGSRWAFEKVSPKGSYSGYQIDFDNVEAVHSYLRALAKFVDTVWFGARLEPHFSLKKIVREGCGGEFYFREGQVELFQALDRHVASSLRNTSNLMYISQNEMFNFDLSNDFMTCRQIYWSDGDHYSRAGEKYFSERFSLPQHSIEGETKN